MLYPYTIHTLSIHYPYFIHGVFGLIFWFFGGLLRYCFNNADEFDNPQDNLRANLLVGSLLHLSEYLYSCSPDDLAKIEAAGKLFRSSDKKNRNLIETNPALTNAKSVRPLLIHESNSYKNRNAGGAVPTDDL